MELEINKQALESCLTEYENLQTQHIDIIKNDSMPDLVAMTRERDKVFIRLKQNLDSFVNAGSHEEAGSLPALETRIASIMDVSQELSKAIQEYKNQLSTGLARMQQGKAAMQGYKTANMNY